MSKNELFLGQFPHMMKQKITIKYNAFGKDYIETKEYYDYFDAEKKAKELSLKNWTPITIISQTGTKTIEITPGFANLMMWSDVNPYEIIKRVSEKCIEVREMKATLKQAPVMHVGGFSAHAENFTQEWDITPEPNNPVIRIRKQKNGDWGNSGRRFTLALKPIYFYDYNF